MAMDSSDIVWSKHKNSGHDQGLQVAYGSSTGTGLATHALIDNNGNSTASIDYGDSPTADQVLKLFPFDYNADGRSDLAVYAYQAANGHGIGWHLYISEFVNGSWKLKFNGKTCL